MVLQDRIFGGALLVFALALFAYYTLWVIVTPFVAADHPVQALFPDRALALLIPAYLFVLVLTVAGTFIGFVMLRAK